MVMVRTVVVMVIWYRNGLGVGGISVMLVKIVTEVGDSYCSGVEIVLIVRMVVR